MTEEEGIWIQNKLEENAALRKRNSELAREAMVSVRCHYDETGSTPQELERFAALIEAEVRGDAEPVAWMYDFLNSENRDEVIRNWVTQNPADIEREKGFNVRPLFAHPAPAVNVEPDANRYRWLKENSARISWNPARFNEHIVDGFAAFGTGYLGYNFEQALDLAMEAALAAVKDNGL